MDNIKNFFLELFFPSFCLGCQKEGFLLCQDCKSILEISEYNYCLCSKNPLRFAPLTRGKPQGKCYRCKDKKLTGLYSALSYGERFLTKRLIHQFKYKPHLKSLSKVLASILIEHFILTKDNTDDIWQNSVLVPVPMEKKRQRARGYNQAEELAKELGHIINVPLVLNNLVKIKETLPQIRLSAREREVNLREAFLIKNPTEIIGKKVFLVDDVYTTGSTMEECARVLKEAGAKSVWGIAIAREG